MTDSTAATTRVGAPRTWRGRLRRLGPAALRYLLLGAATNVALAFALALLVDVSQSMTQSAQAWTGQDVWTVTCWERVGAEYVLSAREGTRNWSPGQACGPPDTPGGGDSPTAWASATQDTQEEWLTLDFPQPVVPDAVRVYETCSTGALCKVTVFDSGGREVQAWKGMDPMPPSGRIGTSQVPLDAKFKTKRVKLYFDSVHVPSWNEVDAVALVATDGSEQWALSAEASSVYGVSAPAPNSENGPAALAPAWSGFRGPPGFGTPAPNRGAAEAVEARGWPMLTLWGRVAAAPPTQGAPGAAPRGMTNLTLSFTGGGGATASLPGSGSGMLVLGGAPSPPAGPVSGRAALPLRPIWAGFAFNTVFYAVVLFLLHWALTAPLRFVREVSRLRRGCCVACGYDLGFDFMPGCPECGWRRGARPVSS